MLDNFTILASGFSLLALLGLALVALWTRDRAAPWLLWWGIPMFGSGLAVIFYMRPGWDTDFVSIVFGNALRIAAVAALWQGIRLFQKRRALLWPVAAVTAGWVALCFNGEFLDNMQYRIIVVSLSNALFCGLAVYELWRDRADLLPSRQPTMLTFASFGLIMAVRAALSGIAPFPVGIHPVDSLWLAGFMFLVFAHGIFATLLFFAMTKERREAEQRNFAMSDPLTGLMNRRAFGDFAKHTGRRRSDLHHTLSLLVLDLDHFKRINDRYGHDVGDHVLQTFAEVASNNVRPTDQLFRMGGEEFCFVLPETEIAEAVIVAERIRRAFAAASIEVGGEKVIATVSIGISGTTVPMGVDLLLAAADAAVYEAKARGRNRVVVAGPASLLQPRRTLLAPQRLRA